MSDESIPTRDACGTGGSERLPPEACSTYPTRQQENEVRSVAALIKQSALAVIAVTAALISKEDV